jgi:hypothetical protein
MIDRRNLVGFLSVAPVALPAAVAALEAERALECHVIETVGRLAGYTLSDAQEEFARVYGPDAEVTVCDERCCCRTVFKVRGIEVRMTSTHEFGRPCRSAAAQA